MTHPGALTEHYEGTDLEALSTLRRYRRWVIDSFGPQLGGTMVEFGAGTGNVAELLRPLASSLDLVEPSRNLQGSLAARFTGDPAVTVHAESLEQWVAHAPDGHYDSVVLVNVLEHIEDDAAALTEIYRMLKPGGHVFLMVPALQALYSDLDALVGHFRRYRLPDLRDLAAGQGFRVVRAHYFDLFGIVPWYIFNTRLGMTEFKPGMASLWDAVFVPVTRAMESLVRPPVGKNVILVGQRPTGA